MAKWNMVTMLIVARGTESTSVSSPERARRKPNPACGRSGEVHRRNVTLIRDAASWESRKGALSSRPMLSCASLSQILSLCKERDVILGEQQCHILAAGSF